MERNSPVGPCHGAVRTRPAYLLYCSHNAVVPANSNPIKTPCSILQHQLSSEQDLLKLVPERLHFSFQVGLERGLVVQRFRAKIIPAIGGLVILLFRLIRAQHLLGTRANITGRQTQTLHSSPFCNGRSRVGTEQKLAYSDSLPLRKKCLSALPSPSGDGLRYPVKKIKTVSIRKVPLRRSSGDQDAHLSFTHELCSQLFQISVEISVKLSNNLTMKLD